jgi:Flp pilus assembly protein TadD
MDNTARLRKDKPAIERLQQGESLMHRKELPQAEARFGEALQLAPNDYAGLCMMARCQLAQNKHSVAQQYTARARAINPTEAQAMQLSGISKLGVRQFGEAYQELDLFEKRLPGDPGVVFLKGVALESMQDRAGAAREYVRFARAVPQGSQSQYAVRRLKEWGYVR